MTTAAAIALVALAGSAGALEPAPARDLGELDRAFSEALSTYRAGDYPAAISALASIVADLELLPPSAEAEAQWSRALLRLAHAEATLGRTDAARAAMELLLGIEADARPDPEQYSPSFRREFERARARVEARGRVRLTVASSGGAAEASVGCRPLGPAPAEARLPPGRYRVAVVALSGRAARASVDLVEDHTVALDLATPGETSLAARPLAPPDPAPRGTPALPGLGSAEPLALRASVANGRGWMRPAAWTAVSLAAVSAGVAVWQGIEAGHYASEARALVLPGGSLAGGADPSAYTAATASYEQARSAAWIAGGAALALSAGAAVLFVLGAPAVEPAPGGAAVRF